MSKDVEMKEVELNELDQEKQPMTGESEKNGSVKVKISEDDVKFTGLSKEELMRVAGTSGWVRTRWALLVLFWLGWVGMLAGAVVIIIQAPRCKPIPEMNWWNKGPLYQIPDVDAFTGDEGLKGVEKKLDSLSQLKVKGLVLGPLHTVQKDLSTTLDLKTIEPTVGTEEDLDRLLVLAHKKGISVVLDLTPNYKGADAWFNNAAGVADDLQAAVDHWLSKGVDGIQVSSLDAIAATSAWSSLQAVVQDNRTEGIKEKALMGAVDSLSVEASSLLLNSSGVDLLLSGALNANQSGVDQAEAILHLYSDHAQTSLGWSLSGGTQAPRHLASRVQPKTIRLYHTLLFTLPGTPVFTYGDEIGLEDQDDPQALWDLQSSEQEKNETAKAVREERSSVRSFFKTMSDLRGKERSLLHGDYVPLHNATSSLAFLRLWDQSERFLPALNWGSTPVTLNLQHSDLPAQARVRLSTDTKKHPLESMVAVDNVELGPGQAVLLSYPFPG